MIRAVSSAQLSAINPAATENSAAGAAGAGHPNGREDRPRLGRRRPFIAAGIPLSAAFFLFAATQHDLVGLAIAVVLFSIFFNAAVDPYIALLADITKVEERGILQGVSMGIQLASQVLFLLVIVVGSTGDEKPAWSYLLVAALLLASFAITVLGVREPGFVDRTEERLGLRGYVAALGEHRQALRYLGAIFVFMFGFNPVLTFLTLFIIKDIGETEQVALALAAGTLLVTAVAAVGFGRLADRIGTKPVLVVGWALLAVAAFGGIIVQHLPEVIAVALLAGIGNGAATAVGWPLLAALVPPEKNGVFAGLKAAAESIAIPASIVVAIVGLLAFGLTRVTGRAAPRTAPHPRLKASRDAGHQAIQFDRPAIVFHTQFGSGDELQWDQQP